MSYSDQAQGSTAGYSVKANAPRDPEFQVALKKLGSLNGRLGELSAIAGQSADKIVGSEPQALHSGDAKVSPVPHGCIAELTKAIDDAASAVERIYRNVTRITNEF